MDNTTSNPGQRSTDAANTAQRTVDAAGAALHSSIDKVAEPVREGVDRASTAAHETVDKVASGASHMANRFSDQAQWACDAPNRALACSRSWVQDNPLEAVGGALLIGLLVGRLSAR